MNCPASIYHANCFRIHYSNTQDGGRLDHLLCTPAVFETPRLPVRLEYELPRVSSHWKPGRGVLAQTTSSKDAKTQKISFVYEHSDQ